MALTRRKNGVYVARYYTDGRKPGSVNKQVIIGKVSYQTAKTKYAELVAGTEALRKRKTTVTLREFEKLFETRHYATVGAKTKENYGFIYAAINSLPLFDMVLDDIRPEHVAEVVSNINSRRLSDATKNNYKIFLKLLFSKAYEWTYIRSNPMKELGVWTGTISKERLNFFGKDEYQRFITALDDDEVWIKYDSERYGKPDTPGLRKVYLKNLAQHRARLPLLKMILLTGSRISEILNLTHEDTDWEHGFIYIKQPKTGNTKKLPLTDEMMDAISSTEKFQMGDHTGLIFENENGRRHTKESTRNTFEAMKAIAYIPASLTIHSLRHTFASWLVQAGTPMKVVQQLLGHSSARSTEIYAHLIPANLTDGMGKLSAILSASQTESIAKASPAKPEETDVNDLNSKDCS